MTIVLLLLMCRPGWRRKKMYSLASFAFYKAIMTVLCWHALAVLTDKDFCACVPVRVCWGCAGVSSGERTSGWGNILALLTTHVCGYTLLLSSFLDVSRMCRYSIYLWITLIGSYIQFSKKAESHLHSIIATYEIYFYQFHHVSTSNVKHSLYILIL